MFLRFYRPIEDKEVYIDSNSIWKIEIDYSERDDAGRFWRTSLGNGIKFPDAVRHYRIFVGSEQLYLRSNPDCPVIKVIEDLCKQSIKG